MVGARVVLLVGAGDNGGDALLAGARLARRGLAAVAVLTGDSAHPAGMAEFVAAGGRVVRSREPGGIVRALSAMARVDLVLDGIVGIGGQPGLLPPADELAAGIPAGVPVVAVDLPSGVDPDTGETPSAHIRADLTVTFGAVKHCLLLPPASHAAGRVEFVDVGLGDALPAQAAVRRLTPRGAGARWPVPGREDHKYRRGVLGVVAGSDTYPGAAVLACSGAVRAGVGVVRYVGPPTVTSMVLQAQPEVVRGVGQVQAWLLGSGVENDDQQDTAIERALGSGLPCVVDAGALGSCVQRRAAGSRPASADSVLLTPHAGELARALGLLGASVTRSDVDARPLHHARWLARVSDTTVLLKGSTTLVVSPDGSALSQDDGPPWLATAGSGDVLAGFAGALLAAGLNAPDAGSVAALVHGRAAARASGRGPIAAGDVAHAARATVAELLELRS